MKKFLGLMIICLLAIPVVLVGCAKGNPVVGIEMNTMPTKTNYYIGEELDLTGATVSIVHENGEVEVVDMSKTSLSNFDSSTLGKKQVIVTYKVDGVEFTTSINYTVVAREPISMSIETFPDKTQFVAGSPIDLTGLTVRILYSAPEGQEGASIVRGLDLLTTDDLIAHEGQTSVKVHFNNLSLDVPIEIVERRPVDARVRLEDGYVLWQYSVFDLSGVVPEILYNDGTYETAPYARYEEYGDVIAEAGHKTVHVTCRTSSGFSKAVEGQLPVRSDAITNLEIVSHPTYWAENKPLTVDGVVLRITTAHNTLECNASDKALSVTTSPALGEVPPTGENEVTITLGGVQVKYTMTIGPNAVASLEATKEEPQSSYYIGEVPMFYDLVLYAIFLDGSKVLVWDGRAGFVAEGVTTKGAVQAEDTQSWVCYGGIYYYIPIRVVTE